MTTRGIDSFVFSQLGKKEFGNKYCIDEYGNVYDEYKNKKLRSSINKQGYKVIKLQALDKKRYTCYIHHLVYYRFVDRNYFINRNHNLQLDHKNQNRLDNHKSNIRAIPIKDNLNNRKARKSGYLTKKTKIKNLNHARKNLFDEMDKLINYLK